MRLITYPLILLLGALSVQAQQIPEKGVPVMQNYTPLDYDKKGKIWDIDSAPNGLVYMAADGGLLEFDGNAWKNFSGSAGNTRSVLVANDSLIFTGSDLDFGVWKRNDYQQFEYHSLYPFRDDLIDLNEEFWQIHKSGENVIFVSAYNLYIYRDDNLTKISAPAQFSDSFTVDDSIYFIGENSGVYLLEDITLTPLFESQDIADFDISAIYEHDEDFVIITFNSGVYSYSSGNLTPVNSPLSRALENSNVFSFEKIDENLIAVGTVQRGLYISDLDGNILHYINRNKGLPNNTILSLHFAQTGKMWVSMDYGVTSIDLNNNITYVYDYRGDFGIGYTAVLKEENLYLGTSKGLYRINWNELNNSREFFQFDLIPDSEGQVWTLEIIDNELYAGHDRGLFILNNSRLELLRGQQGYWTVLPYKNYLLGGTYNGISVFEKEGERPVFLKKMDLIRGSTNQVLIQDQNILWVNIPNYGIIRAELNEELNPENRLIFPIESFEGNEPYINISEDNLLVLTNRYTYTYSVPDSSFIRNKRAVHSRRPENLISGTHQPIQLNDVFDFFPVYNGFALRKKDVEFNRKGNNRLVLRKFEAYNNEESYFLHINESIPYAFNNLRIDLLVPNSNGTEYQFKIDPGGDWSGWSENSEIQLVNLSYGTKTLLVNAKINSEIVDTYSTTFKIAAPWYWSWYAYLFYTLALLGGIYLLHLWQKLILKKKEKKFLQNKQQTLRELDEKHRQKISEMEQKRLQAEYDLLEKQLRTKTLELANKAKENQDKNRLLMEVKEKVEKIQEKSDTPNTRWKEIFSLLQSYINQDDNTFEIQMDDLHQEFYQELKDNYPDLSTNDLRMCAYLKLGFNSKEIADFSNIQPSSVYISRSRLRKKLDLSPEQNLHEFLNKF